jgi:tRNA(Ile)-lysidine synthetase-like protein
MKLVVPAGRYVVAVSGGVDSMVLLDLLARHSDLQLTVAHFDHGIREDSSKDRLLVQKVASKHRLPFVYNRVELGPGTSEAVARKARYEFLHTVRVAARAQAVITAHHQDDMLETAVINMLRGTGRRGLSSLKSQDRVLRPLLLFSKAEITAYAESHNVSWREDSTNQDETYLRNYVRRQILAKFSEAQRQQLLVHLNTASQLNQELEVLLVNNLHIQPAAHQLDRAWFIQLPHSVAKEVLASWLRERGATYDTKTLERLLVAAKTYQPHKRTDVSNGYILEVKQKHLALTRVDR